MFPYIDLWSVDLTMKLAITFSRTVACHSVDHDHPQRDYQLPELPAHDPGWQIIPPTANDPQISP